jgi:hypothetical protein
MFFTMKLHKVAETFNSPGTSKNSMHTIRRSDSMDVPTGDFDVDVIVSEKPRLESSTVPLTDHVAR